MASEVNICNRALLRIDGAPITSLNDESKEAVACKLIFDMIRDEVLVAHPWNFALSSSQLQLVDSTPINGYAHEYSLPSDCLRVLQTDQDDYYPWKIEGKRLFTDASGIVIRYIRREEDTTVFAPMFTGALTLRLASELAYPVCGSTTRGGDLLQEYMLFLKEAKLRDGQEGTPDSIIADYFINARTSY